MARLRRPRSSDSSDDESSPALSPSLPPVPSPSSSSSSSSPAPLPFSVTEGRRRHRRLVKPEREDLSPREELSTVVEASSSFFRDIARDEEKRSHEENERRLHVSSLPSSSPLRAREVTHEAEWKEILKPDAPSKEEAEELEALQAMILDVYEERERRRQQITRLPFADPRNGNDDLRVCKQERILEEEEEMEADGMSPNTSRRGVEQKKIDKNRETRRGEEDEEEEGRRRRGEEEETQEETRKLRYDAVYASEPLTLRKQKTSIQWTERSAPLDPDVKKKLVHRAVLVLLFAIPYAARQSDLREMILPEETLKKISIRLILKEAAKSLRSYFGLILHSLGERKSAKQEEFYYLSQGVAHALHIQSLTSDREHCLRGFLLFLVPCFTVCRGVLHASDLASYLTACGRRDIIAGFSDVDLADLARPENHKINGLSLRDSPTHLNTLRDFLLECKLLKYIQVFPPSDPDGHTPQSAYITPTDRFVEELSLETFRGDCQEKWEVPLPDGDLAGDVIVGEEEDEEHDETSSTSSG
ncbi:hypothetical protein CSUI_001802 [Cystoisospora suis]|uniref:Uncharacterized protein n=1 Tax=Cystoisospora suis TaxID=483139 RepID=A0A2C6L925_9APIC|nr:hypothetical protein CSUI_001802 [Cystoisospora suis]